MDLIGCDQFSDFTIVLPDKTYKVHKLILNRCDYFRALFSYTNKEVTTSEVKFDYDSKLFDLFISSVYSGKEAIEINPEIVMNLLDLALYFQYPSLIDNCIDVIGKVGTNNNLFVNAIMAHPFISEKMQPHIFRYNCSMCLDTIIQEAARIPNWDLLVDITTHLEDTSITNIIKIVTSWLSNHEVDNTKWDIEDILYNHEYSIDYYTLDSKLKYDPKLLFLVGRALQVSLQFMSEKRTAIIKLTFRVTDEGIMISDGCRNTVHKARNEWVSFKARLNPMEVKLKLDEFGMLKVEIVQGEEINCYFRCDNTTIIYKTSRYGDVTLNTLLLDGNIYKLYILGR